MAKSSWSHALVWVSLAGALAGCSTVPDNQQPAHPPLNALDAATTGDEPVPQVESPSRTGNADTYVVFGRRYRVKETSAGYRERGTASWYGWDFHGRKTSSGPPFNMFELTAAHKSLPLPTYVRVTNLENGRNTVVKVTDRGPFVGTRLIDLSYAAAVRLGMQDRGTAPVEVVALEPYQFLPKLAAYRAEQRELLASRAEWAKPKTEAAEIEFARAAPIRPSAPARVLASLERNPLPVKTPAARLALVDVERNAPKAVAKTPTRLAPAGVERNAPKAVAKTPMRLALAGVERNAPKAVAKTPTRLALADVERNAPKAVAKTANVKPTRAEDDRNPGRAGIRPPSAAPALKGREAVVKPPLPATNANRNGKPVPPRQASASGPMAVRLASLKTSRSRGVAD
ncbi:MAG: septal ring lytic transglycosylase RlpA family protein [Candidatus Contendobacter sp.]